MGTGGATASSPEGADGTNVGRVGSGVGGPLIIDVPSASRVATRAMPPVSTDISWSPSLPFWPALATLSS